MEEDIKFFVGLDVHKDALVVAEAGRAAARMVGRVAHDVSKLRKLLARYGAQGQVRVLSAGGGAIARSRPLEMGMLL